LIGAAWRVVLRCFGVSIESTLEDGSEVESIQHM
jgi:hypothetical protein